MRNRKIAFGRYCADLNWLVVAFVLLLALGPIAVAQSPSAYAGTGGRLRLKNYPAVRASLERVSAAQAGVGLARTSYLPRADMLWQTNRATDNNITGLLLPQSVIAPITGAVTLSPSNRSAWGSAAGLLFSWEPFDFGYRGAKVDAARAVRNQATAEASVTRLDVAVATVNAYLTVLAAEQTVQAARADVERRETFNKAVRVLVDNQLRAGADASRADAELARAKVNLARAQQQEQVSRAVLADILGMPDTSVEVRASSLLGPPPNASSQTTPSRTIHCQGRTRARGRGSFAVRILERAYYPKFYFQSAVFGREAASLRRATSWWDKRVRPGRSNWATGVTVTFPVFDIFTIRSRKAVEAANERAEAARYDQTLQDLTGQFRSSGVSRRGPPRAENTPWNSTPRARPRTRSARVTKQGCNAG